MLWPRANVAMAMLADGHSYPIQMHPNFGWNENVLMKHWMRMEDTDTPCVQDKSKEDSSDASNCTLRRGMVIYAPPRPWDRRQ